MRISKRVRAKLGLFRQLSKKNLRTQKKKLKDCPDEVICDLSALINEICNNKNLELNKKQLKKIRKFKKFMRGLNRAKGNNKKRSHFVKHLKGGFLAVLAPLLASLASSAVPLISKLIG